MRSLGEEIIRSGQEVKSKDETVGMKFEMEEKMVFKWNNFFHTCNVLNYNFPTGGGPEMDGNTVCQ